MKIIECPRDAMQGLHDFIPTEDKIRYINQLLKVGFDTIDFGSFVSPKVIPQMRDTAKVLSKLDTTNSSTKLLAIVANLRGAEEAASHKEITYLGFPLSLSETFQQRNTNKSIDEALAQLADIQNLCIKSDKTLVTYLSMGFGNPYDEPWNSETVGDFVSKLDQMGINIIALSDTVGAADKASISYIFGHIIPAFPHIEFGAHLHTLPETAMSKIEAAVHAGCKRFDAAIKGYGGCPMATDALTGNMDTLILRRYLIDNALLTSELDNSAFQSAVVIADEIFPN